MTDRFTSILEYKMNQTSADIINATKQLLQEMILSGLSRGGFFNKASFNGGTALRIIYGLERFSEDLDFSLIQSNPDFTFEKYIPQLKLEFDAMGLDVTFSEREKKIKTPIKTSFFKGNARELILTLNPDERLVKDIIHDQKIEIKFKVDTDPPAGAHFERRIHTMPLFYTLTMHDLPTLYAGKVSALLCRTYLNRVKGRDLFDFVWYVKNKVPLNLEHTEYRMKKRGCIDEDVVFDINLLKTMLITKFKILDFKEAARDAKRFVEDRSAISDWCSEYFISLTDEIRIADYSKALVKEKGEYSSFGPGSKANILPKQ